MPGHTGVDIELLKIRGREPRRTADTLETTAPVSRVSAPGTTLGLVSTAGCVSPQTRHADEGADRHPSPGNRQHPASPDASLLLRLHDRRLALLLDDVLGDGYGALFLSFDRPSAQSCGGKRADGQKERSLNEGSDER